MVPISPDIYSGGAVIFDTRSLFDYQQKLADRRAKKQAAEQEALDTYLKEMSKIPESYGMRNIDKKEFAKKVDDFRLLSNEFRKSPKNLEKRLQLEQAADRLKLFVSRSKEAKEGTKSFNNFIADIATNPEKRKSVDIQRLMLDKEIHDLPLDFNAPYLGIVREDKEFNPNYYIPKPFDFQKTFDESAKGPGIAISELGVGPSKTKGYDEIKKGFGESAIKSIASNFAKNVEADDEKESYYRVRFNNLTPEKLAEQNIRLKKYFPKMEVDDDNPVSLAMAEAIEEAERRTSTDLRAKGTGTGGGYGYSGDQDILKYDLLGKYKGQDIDIEAEKAVATGKAPSQYAPKLTKIVFTKDIPSEDYSLITNKESVSPYSLPKKKGEKERLSYFIVRDDGNWEGGGGQIIERASVARANLDKTSLSEQQRIQRGALKFPDTKKDNLYNIKGKSYTESQLLKMGYTKEQIAPYIKK